MSFYSFIILYIVVNIIDGIFVQVEKSKEEIFEILWKMQI